MNKNKTSLQFNLGMCFFGLWMFMANILTWMIVARVSVLGFGAESTNGQDWISELGVFTAMCLIVSLFFLFLEGYRRSRYGRNGS